MFLLNKIAKQQLANQTANLEIKDYGHFKDRKKSWLYSWDSKDNHYALQTA